MHKKYIYVAKLHKIELKSTIFIAFKKYLTKYVMIYLIQLQIVLPWS